MGTNVTEVRKPLGGGKRFVGTVTELAVKSTAGTLSQDEQAEYEHIVRLNDLLSLLKLQQPKSTGRRVLRRNDGGAPCTTRIQQRAQHACEIVACPQLPPYCRIKLIILLPSAPGIR